MKAKILLLISSVFLLFSFTQKLSSDIKAITKDYVLIPTGKAGSTQVLPFYISSTEISNKQYREFLNDLRTKGETTKLKLATVDSTKWKNSATYNEPFVQYYFQHPAYNDYPVVNITKQGAELYCEWLSDKYNSVATVKVRFSLPSEAQWILAAKGGNTTAIYPWEGNSLIFEKKGKWKGDNMCNYRVEKTVSHKGVDNPNADITAPCKSFFPNAYGIYNLSDNVSEMIDKRPYTKGGSWYSKADKLTIDEHEEYASGDLPSPTVGFRPIMIIK